MKKLLKILIPLLIFGALSYQFRSTLSTQFFSLKDNLYGLFVKTPCAEPIHYTIGTFNPQFNISINYFLSALTEAKAIWEKPLGKELFVYDPINFAPDVLKINLIYDYRQQATSKLESLGIVVKDDRASYDTLKAKFTTLKAEYEKEKSSYTTLVADFNQKKTAYETEVNYWNNKGGAPKTEYDKVNADRLALVAESQTLQDMQNRLNGIVEELNALVVVLNRLVSTLNISVEQYNTVNIARGESFEEGVYTSNGSNKKIDIYEFNNRAKLVRVLTHELGHALGLGHVNDPKAIMYKLNQSSNLSLTEADLAELKLKCGVK